MAKKFHVCERCRRSGFVLEIGIFKPMFRCAGCDASWCYGYDGGQYFIHARNVGATTPLDWVEHPDVTSERLGAAVIGGRAYA